MEMLSERIVIKERPSLRYTLSVGLISFIPALVLSFFAINPIFLISAFLFCTSFLVLLSRTSSLVITDDGICQKFCGLPLYFIKWSEIENVSYSEAFPGPRYSIRPGGSWITTIDLPIDDENFPIIKKALAARGLVLAKGADQAKQLNS
jgi:hypothetical protein